MALQKTLFKPGINREGTDYSNEGGWFDVNLVRFRKGLPEKFGGWVKNNLKRSSMLRVLNEGKYDEVPAQMKRWNKAKGKVLAGLTRRREAEALMFEGKDWEHI